MKLTKIVSLTLCLVLALMLICPLTVHAYVGDPQWTTEVEPVEDYAYSFAVVGDTQVVNRFHPEEYHKIYKWIVDNAEEKKIAYVMGLGDITDGDSSQEWQRAQESFWLLAENGIQHSQVRGNHDSKERFELFIGGDMDYQDSIQGAFNDKMANTWRLLEIGEVKYLIFALDYGFGDDVMAWAGEIIERYPEHNVIITTHAYMYRDKTTLDAGDECPPSETGGKDGDYIWENFISKYENIKLVLCGHIDCDNVQITEQTGDHGNKVTQILIDPQGLDKDLGPTGLVAMFYFSEDGRKVKVQYYSTIRGDYEVSSEITEFTLDVVEPTAPESTEPAPTEPSAEPAPQPTGFMAWLQKLIAMIVAFFANLFG
ncbi:MAG: hypothetical protein E7453_07185 [Ruminococcaceae bacterium]|nr:hypothetical protein [Oscillospiraceae bacterium]